MTDFALTTDWLAARAAVTPAALAVIEAGHMWSYGELDARVTSAGRWLGQLGVDRGDHVAVMLPNCLAYMVLIHALARVGAVLVPLNTRLSAAEIAWQLALAGCTWYIATADRDEMAEQRSPNIRTVIVSERLEEVPDNLLRAMESQWDEPRGLDRLQSIIFTSGTTGRPKGAMLTYGNHFHSAVASAFRLGLLPTDRWLLCMPLYHVGGLAIVLRACLYGTTIVLQDGFHPERVAESLADQGVTIVSLVPTMLHRLLDKADPLEWRDLRLILLGGAAATEDLMNRAGIAEIPLATTYGLTEATSQVATLPPAGARQKPGCVGQPLLFTEVRIVDNDGRSAAIGEIGEICVRGPSVFAGYYGDAAATAATLRSGELHTGDLGYLDLDGDLWVVQRRSDLIVTGGENVYPAEVEQVLTQHPAVVAACVVGVPDDEWGHRVAALVVTDGEGSSAQLMAFARQHLAGYKVPRLIRFVDALPQTGSGKVSRTAVQTMLQGAEVTSQ